ncbi:MAG TPA: hypothetical protein VKF61_07835 [Candidatus Polarisedimenticolia bacterium]|nr:hypothetical protein [Candidatus Polarisedimenticolia bacterium]
MNRVLMRSVALAMAAVLFLSLAATPAAARDASKGRWLKIRVYAHGSTTPTVLVNLPMSFVSAAVKVLSRSGAQATIDASLEGSPEGGRSDPRHREIDLEALVKELESMDPGQILEVQEDDGRVSIWIE